MDLIFQECGLNYSELGNLVVAKLHDYKIKLSEYKKDCVRYDKSSKEEKEKMEMPIEPNFEWDIKLGNCFVRLSDEEFSLISNDTAGLLLSGGGFYDPSTQRPFEGQITLREAINGYLAILFSTPDIVYGTNMALTTIIIGENYSKIATTNSLYQLSGRAGRTGRSLKAKVIFINSDNSDNSIISIKKAVLPPEYHKYVYDNSKVDDILENSDDILEDIHFEQNIMEYFIGRA